MAQEPSPAEVSAANVGEAVHGQEIVGGTTEVAAHGGDSGGLPQFEFEHWGGQILWLLILFGIFYFLVARVFTPRLRRVLEARQETISEAIAEARRAQAEADEQAAKAQAEIADARGKAQRIAADARAKSKAEFESRLAAEEAVLAKQLEEAETRIRGTRKQAMAQIPEIAKETAEAVIAKLASPATADELARVDVNA